jgi:Ca2+/Na+ antiporter
MTTQQAVDHGAPTPPSHETQTIQLVDQSEQSSPAQTIESDRMPFPDCWMFTLCLDHIDQGDAAPAGVLFEILLFAYCFLGLAIACDKHLIVALETLCLRWNVREDVAGATFLAFGSAAPEIVINSVATMKSAGNSDAAAHATSVGISAIIGSGMIAFCVIPAACGLAAAPSTLELKRRPLLRDITFYFIGLTCLVLFFADGAIQEIESVCLVSFYALYVLVVIVSPWVRQTYREYMDPALKFVKRKSFVEERNEKLLVDDSVADITSSKGAPATTKDPETSKESSAPELLHKSISRTIDLLSAPYDFLFRWTMPNAQAGAKYEWLYPLTLLIALAYVGCLSFVISTIAQRWSDLLKLPGAAFGLYLISIGAEVPDTIQSVVAAKRGYGNMALSSCIGSQICNILLGLGMPWLIFNLVTSKPVQVDSTPKYLEVPAHKTLRNIAFFQFATVGTFFLLLLGHVALCRLEKAVLNTVKSYILLGVYFAVLAGIGVTIALHIS